MSGLSKQHGHCGTAPGKCGGAQPQTDEESSSVVGMFRGFAAQLDSKHDRYERLVKKSRDVTIESKRIIFMLHRVTEGEDRAGLLEQASARFRQLEASVLRAIASELLGQDPYLFMRAISPGLQEYIEALSFYHYLLREELISWAEAQDRLTFATELAGGGGASPQAPGQTAPAPASVTGAEERQTAPEGVPNPAQPVSDQPATDARPQALVLPLPYHEYVLGVADLTGELMRRCISSVSSGQLQHCWKLCAVLRSIHEGFVNIGNAGPREITRKMQTLRQSVAKVENACYQLKVRGEEMPQHMLADVFSAGDDYRPPDDYSGD